MIDFDGKLQATIHIYGLNHTCEWLQAFHEQISTAAIKHPHLANVGGEMALVHKISGHCLRELGRVAVKRGARIDKGLH